MPPILTFEDQSKTITLEGSDPSLRVSNPKIVSLIGHLDTLHDGVALDRFLFEKNEPPPNQWRYRLEAADGRVWRQDVDIPPNDQAGMTFHVPDFWKLAEFAPHRALREVVIDLARNNGVTKILADWT